MEEVKYFVPEIEDIRVGYECEIWHSTDTKRFESYKITPSDYDVDWASHIEEGSIRVPYLTKEQVEAEGWEKIGTPFWKGNHQVYYDGDKHQLHIVDTSGDTYYIGSCKDINTFRYICKLLGI